jgi:hypothetical protein
VDRIERLGESSFSKDHHHVIRLATFSGSITQRIVNPHYNFLILTVGLTGTPTPAFREARLTLADGTTGRVYWRDVPAPVVGSPTGDTPLFGVPILLLKGRPLDLTIRAPLVLDVLEILFRGIRF